MAENLKKVKPKNLIKKHQLAEMAGVSQKSISLACGKSLKDAVYGDRVDLDHDNVQFYIREKQHQKTLEEQKNKKGKKKRPNIDQKIVVQKPRPLEVNSVLPSFQDLDPIFVASLLDKTLGEIMNLYGNEERFKSWLDSYKKIIETKSKEMDLDAKQRSLVSRDLLEKYLFGYWDGLQERLLNDVPKSASARLQAIFNSGGSIEEAEEAVRDIISKQIRGAKAKAKRTLENA